MEIEFFGANCFKFKTKKVTIVVDDNLGKIGGGTIQTDKTTLLYTAESLVDESATSKARVTLEGPGEFEVGDLTITGLQTRSHMDKEDEKTATVFQFMIDGRTVTVLGHIHPDIDDATVDFISGTDVLITPVGGNGYTLDPTGAAKVIKRTEPGVVIPSQYEIKGLNYEVPAQELSEFGELQSVTLGESQDSLKFSNISDEESTGQAKVVVLNVKSK